MTEPLFDHDALIYREMMTHIPLFAHRNPQKIAILDENQRGLSEEVLKHPTVATVWQAETPHAILTDPRISYFANSINEFLLRKEGKDSLDVLIIGSVTKPDFNHCFESLHKDGLFIQLCESTFDLLALKNIQQQLKATGFADILPLNFPQPNFTSGWRAAILASKEGTVKRPREKDIFNKTFSTSYYNLDMHRAAFALPEFMREKLA